MILQPSWSNSPELHFFKSILRCKVALGIKRTRHQLAPALPVQKIMDRAVAGCVPDRPLIGRLEIMDVSTSRTSEKSVGTLHVMNCRHGYPLRPAFYEGTRVNVTNLPTQEVAGRGEARSRHPPLPE
jgi:hypothetical protein